MAHRAARTLFFTLLLTLGLCLSGKPIQGTSRSVNSSPQTGRAVFLCSELSKEDLVVLTANLAASGHKGIVLMDSPRLGTYTKAFLATFRPERVVPVGTFPDGLTDLEKRLNVKTEPVLAWRRGPPRELWRFLFPRAETVVVCTAEPHGLLLQAACLAGVLQAPLYVTGGQPKEADALKQQLLAWDTRQVYLVGDAPRLTKGEKDLRVIRLADEEAVAASYLRHQLARGPIQNLVVANPEDVKDGLGGMSSLAPWIALQRRAALLLTNPAGDNVEEVVRKALRDRHLCQADALILVAGLQAVPMQRRPNPIPDDKDKYIEMEPLTPTGSEPFSFATGRLFHDDPAVVLLQLARQRLLAERRAPRKALVASNPTGGLPLLETFSRNTAQELRNAGYQTTALFGKGVSGDEVRHLLPEHDIFLWEGHHSTLIKEYAFPEWNEPLPPSFIFLQSCLALTEWKAQPLLQRGAVGVVGSSTRTYSGSGGACSLAFFDALLYEDQSLGASLRQAKNFLLAYALLKEKRLGKEAKRGGANQRAAWAFTLWGDPTLKLPRPETPKNALDPIRHEVRGNTIILTLPSTPHAKVSTDKYQVETWPNARLAGLLRKESDDDGQPLVPFVFAEVALPKAPDGQTPQLRSRLPSSHWVFCWDHRRRCGYLLVAPRPRDQKELRFHVEWESD